MSIAAVAQRISDDVDDVLSTIPLAHGDRHLEDELFGRLVDLELESMLVDLVSRLADGSITPDRYGRELTHLAAACERVGLVP